MDRLNAETLAEVHAGGVTTRYRRAGGGNPVLLLCDVADERFVALVELLARTHRVIAPLATSTSTSTSTDEDLALTGVDGLAAFLDGLGLASAPVVGVDRAAGPAAGFARLYPDRVDRLVLLGELETDPAGQAAAVLAALQKDD